MKVCLKDLQKNLCSFLSTAVILAACSEGGQNERTQGSKPESKSNSTYNLNAKFDQQEAPTIPPAPHVIPSCDQLANPAIGIYQGSDAGVYISPNGGVTATGTGSWSDIQLAFAQCGLPVPTTVNMPPPPPPREPTSDPAPGFVTGGGFPISDPNDGDSAYPDVPRSK